jgi:hypothetical protein
LLIFREDFNEWLQKKFEKHEDKPFVEGRIESYRLMLKDVRATLKDVWKCVNGSPGVHIFACVLLFTRHLRCLSLRPASHRKSYFNPLRGWT